MILESNETYLVFSDGHNTTLLYDNYQCCCEDFGYYISKTLEEVKGGVGHKDLNLTDYNFVTDYRPLIQDDSESDGNTSKATFQLNSNDSQLFLTLYNSHNGYYHHNYKMTSQGEIFFEGRL